MSNDADWMVSLMDEVDSLYFELCRDAGYRGWYGIDSSGREGITKGKELPGTLIQDAARRVP